MEQTAARLKNGRPLQNPLLTRQDGFVEAVPSRVFRDGTGTFTVNLSRRVGISFLSTDDTNVLKMVIDLDWKRKFKLALIVREFRHP
jgi:hypothetical protein